MLFVLSDFGFNEKSLSVSPAIIVMRVPVENTAKTLRDLVDYLQSGKPKKITIQEGDNQNELILFKSRCLFDTISEEEIEKDGFHLRLIKTKVKNKELDTAKTI